MALPEHLAQCGKTSRGVAEKFPVCRAEIIFTRRRSVMRTSEMADKIPFTGFAARRWRHFTAVEFPLFSFFHQLLDGC